MTAFARLNNNSLYNVTILDNYPEANNVSGPPLNGVPYNGHVFSSFFSFVSSLTRLCRLIFNASTNINVQSRANAIRTGIPNAIFRQAEQAPGGPEAVFADPNGFLTYTRRIYVCHHWFFLGDLARCSRSTDPAPLSCDEVELFCTNK